MNRESGCSNRGRAHTRTVGSKAADDQTAMAPADSLCADRRLRALAKAIVKQRCNLPHRGFFIVAVRLDPHRCPHRGGQQHHRDDIARAHASTFAHEE